MSINRPDNRDTSMYNLEVEFEDGTRKVIGQFPGTIEGRKEAMGAKKTIQGVSNCCEAEFKLVLPNSRRT